LTQRDSLSDAAIRDTLDAVFASREFAGVPRETVLSRVLNWFGELLRELMQLTGGSRLLYYTVLLLTIALVLAIVVRVLYVAHARGALRRRGAGVFGTAAGGSDDPWTAAQRLAAEGDYTAAAHALYGAILQRAAGEGLVRLHRAKTIGDYAREMRARASASLLATFREFARGYEYVVYGVGECDRERYERLFGLAARLVGHA
jgi:hypothetical protein